MGLSICKQICKALGGDIWLESTSNEGSVFVFSMTVFKAPQICDTVEPEKTLDEQQED